MRKAVKTKQTPKQGRIGVNPRMDRLSMSVENSKPMRFLKTTPKGWIRASLPKFKATSQEVIAQTPLTKKDLEEMPWFQRHKYLHAYALERQERRWEDEVGIKPADSHFTLLVPIYNEEEALPSFLNSLLLSDIPASINMNMIFITNGCSDASSILIDEFLSSLGIVEEKPLHKCFKDEGLNVTYKIVERGSITFMHLETRTRGKANALHIGNSLAYASGHIIVMSVDANNYLEPDAIRLMFTHAQACFRRSLQANDTVLLNGVIQAEKKVSVLRHLLTKVHRLDRQLVDGKSLVNGCLMAWNAKWMHIIGGPPKVALEDYAMGIVALVNNFQVERVEGANIWVYEANNLQGLVNTRARYIRGKMQILDFVHYDSSVVKIIEKDAYYMKKLPDRLRHLLGRCKQSPWNLPRYVGTFLLWEYALRKAKRDYRQNPTNQSWEKVDFTY